MSLESLILERLERTGAPVPAVEQLKLHQLYLSLLAKWTKAINLTALPVDPPTDAAIDRLLVEPIAASRFAADVETIIDLGTGGGSPAIPFWIQTTNAHLTMVESRSRKCAFLRESVRQIKPGRGQAIDVRFEDLLGRHPELRGSADVVTIRAVRMDEPMVSLLSDLLKPDGRVFRFTTADDDKVQDGITCLDVHPLVSGTASVLQILRCSTWNISSEKHGSS